MMILQLSTESGHPMIMEETSRCFSARWFLSISSVSMHSEHTLRLGGFVQRNGQKFIRRFSWRFLYREFWTWCLKMQDAHLAETQQSLRPTRPEHQQRQRQNQQCKKRRKLRLLRRSENWMAVLQRATENPAGSIFIFIFTTANELELMAVYIIWEMVVISVSWKEFQKIDGACRQDTHSQYTSVQYSLFTSAERTPRAWLMGRHGSSHYGLHFIVVRLKRICHLVLHMSRPLLFSHLPFTTSTSSSLSLFLLPRHKNKQHNRYHLQEHPVHHAHLQALPVDKLRHQETLWRENLQSARNPRTTTPTETARKKESEMKRASMNKSILFTHFQSGGGTLNHTGGTLFSQWYDGLSENSDFWNASW